MSICLPSHCLFPPAVSQLYGLFSVHSAELEFLDFPTCVTWDIINNAHTTTKPVVSRKPLFDTVLDLPRRRIFVSYVVRGDLMIRGGFGLELDVSAGHLAGLPMTAALMVDGWASRMTFNSAGATCQPRT